MVNCLREGSRQDEVGGLGCNSTEKTVSVINFRTLETPPVLPVKCALMVAKLSGGLIFAVDLAAHGSVASRTREIDLFWPHMF